MPRRFLACVHCGSMLEEDERLSGVCGRCALSGKKPKPLSSASPKPRAAASPAARAASRPAPKPAPAPVPTGPGKILLIDDEMLLVKLLKKRLESAGHTVVTAGDGKEGYGKIRPEKPDLIITDLLMPEMTGYDLLQKLKKETDGIQHIPVILITAKGGMDKFFGGWEIHAYLTKPLDPAELLRKAEELIQLGRRLRARKG